jgi:DNA-binding XRE family transcriptional regulator
MYKMNELEIVEQNGREATHASEQRERLSEIAKRIAAQRPTLEQLVASGECSGPYPHGAFMDFLVLLSELKAHREQQGLSLGDISRKTGLTPPAISKLENGRTNPTLQTLLRYIDAVGGRLKWVAEEPAVV